MKVYIDISEFLKIDAITGIQRVMREIIVRFIGYKEFETILLSYSEKNDYFKIFSLIWMSHGLQHLREVIYYLN